MKGQFGPVQFPGQPYYLPNGFQHPPHIAPPVPLRHHYHNLNHYHHHHQQMYYPQQLAYQPNYYCAEDESYFLNRGDRRCISLRGPPTSTSSSSSTMQRPVVCSSEFRRYPYEEPPTSGKDSAFQREFSRMSMRLEQRREKQVGGRFDRKDLSRRPLRNITNSAQNDAPHDFGRKSFLPLKSQTNAFSVSVSSRPHRFPTSAGQKTTTTHSTHAAPIPTAAPPVPSTPRPRRYPFQPHPQIGEIEIPRFSLETSSEDVFYVTAITQEDDETSMWPGDTELERNSVLLPLEGFNEVYDLDGMVGGGGGGMFSPIIRTPAASRRMTHSTPIKKDKKNEIEEKEKYKYRCESDDDDDDDSADDGDDEEEEEEDEDYDDEGNFMDLKFRMKSKTPSLLSKLSIDQILIDIRNRLSINGEHDNKEVKIPPVKVNDSPTSCDVPTSGPSATSGVSPSSFIASGTSTGKTAPSLDLAAPAKKKKSLKNMFNFAKVFKSLKNPSTKKL